VNETDAAISYPRFTRLPSETEEIRLLHPLREEAGRRVEDLLSILPEEEVQGDVEMAKTEEVINALFPMVRVSGGQAIADRWAAHVEEWLPCARCPLNATAGSHVLAKGDIPCDVLYLGEAPGSSEDSLSEPFIGPAGKLMDRLLSESKPRYGETSLKQHYKYLLSNILACAPWLDLQARTVREPSKEEAQACSPRIIELIELAKPKGIVYVGRVAERFGPDTNLPTIEITHPAYFLHETSPRKDLVLDWKRNVLKLRGFLERIL